MLLPCKCGLESEKTDTSLLANPAGALLHTTPHHCCVLNALSCACGRGCTRCTGAVASTAAGPAGAGTREAECTAAAAAAGGGGNSHPHLSLRLRKRSVSNYPELVTVRIMLHHLPAHIASRLWPPVTPLLYNAMNTHTMRSAEHVMQWVATVGLLGIVPSASFADVCADGSAAPTGPYYTLRAQHVPRPQPLCWQRQPGPQLLLFPRDWLDFFATPS